MSVGLTTSGITALYLEKHFNKSFKTLNDIDVSLDSPYEDEHNENRGNKIFSWLLKLSNCAKPIIKNVLLLCVQ